MKNIVITTALVLAFAAPAFAQTQLELSLGVEAGKYTTAQLVRLNAATSETGIESKVVFSENKGHSARAAAIFAEIDAEETGNKGLPVLAGNPVSYSSKGGHSALAAAIFAEMAAAEDAADK